jgi:hypothetical protein
MRDFIEDYTAEVLAGLTVVVMTALDFIPKIFQPILQAGVLGWNFLVTCSKKS